MEIGQVIRKYRKEKDMTQEEMARRLGVTAPAVNKWESGASAPDIALLAPIARMLGITTDTLLCFREALTEEEIRRFVQEAGERLRKEDYDDVFNWAKSVLEQYPNCDSLIWQMALLLDVPRRVGEIPEEAAEQYDAYISSCYARALESGDEGIRLHGAAGLFGFYFWREEYDRAEGYLAYYSEEDPERKRRQGDIYSRTGRVREAYKLYEELVFSGYHKLQTALQSISQLAKQEKDMETVRFIVEKQTGLARLMEIGQYQEATMEMDLAMAEKDPEATMRIAGKLLSCIEDMTSYSRSRLYGHMEFKELSEEFCGQMRETLIKALREEENFGYMKGEARWQELLESCGEVPWGQGGSGAHFSNNR